MLEHEVGEATEDPRTILRRSVLPLGERALRRRERTPSLPRAHPRHIGHYLAGGRVHDGEGFAGVGVDPLSVDVCLPAKELRYDRGHRATIIEHEAAARSIRAARGASATASPHPGPSCARATSTSRDSSPRSRENGEAAERRERGDEGDRGAGSGGVGD